MWFRNLLIYSLESDWSLTAGALEEQLAKRTLQPCNAMSTESRGWVAPIDDGQLVQGLERHLLIALGTETKLLPSSVLIEAVKQRATEFEKEKGFKPGRKQLRDFKEIISAELLPRAFTRRNATRAWIDPVAKRIIVDASSPGRAEQVIEILRETLGELPVSLPQTEAAPGQKLTDWLSARRAPGRFNLNEECELMSGDAAKSVVRYVRHNLDVQQIQRHLEEGLRASRLAMSWNGRLSFVVNDKLEVKRLKFVEMDEAEDDPAIDPARQFEAEFTLMTGQVGPMIDDLLEVMSIRTGAIPVAANDTTESNEHESAYSVPDHDQFSEEPDPAYEVALKLVRDTNKASVSWVQRRLKIGYNRAARLVERMEEAGVVGPAGAGGERKVLSEAVS